jgi:hypothetical protein
VIALAALLLGAAPAQSVADAERAFAATAQAGGQWAAFRATAAPDAILWAPGPVNAQRYLAGLPEPSVKLAWRPAHTITACDGTLAYSTGPFTRGGETGTFGTIWRHGPDGWRWIYDNGHDGAAPPASAGVVEDRSACGSPPRGGPGLDDTLAPQSATALAGGALAGVIVASDGALPATFNLAAPAAEGASADRTLFWRVSPITGGKVGARLLRLWSWDGRRYRLVVLDYSSGG